MVPYWQINSPLYKSLMSQTSFEYYQILEKVGGIPAYLAIYINSFTPHISMKNVSLRSTS